jgi:16S rRNA C1402 (ribose-2'-O) methylase RsmI
MLELRRTAKLERAARLETEALLHQNQTLIRESDHRVMNSLQLVQAVLTMQIRGAADEMTKSQLSLVRVYLRSPQSTSNSTRPGVWRMSASMISCGACARASISRRPIR